MNTLKTKLESRKATAAVIGLGYVGLPLAMEIAAAGFKVIGIDLDATKIAALKQGKSYILDVPEKLIADTIHTGQFTPTSDFSALSRSRYRQHLRTDPSQQEPRSGHLVYSFGDRRDSKVFA